MRYLSGITRTYLKILRAKNYYLSDPGGVNEDALEHIVHLSKRAEKIFLFIPKSALRNRERRRPMNKRIKIRKAIDKTYYKKKP